MTLPSLINVIAVGLSWYVIPLSRSWPNDIRFESQSGARATLWSSIDVPPFKGIETVPISSLQMSCPAAAIKSMLLARVLLKRRRSLHRCRDAHESRNQVALMGFCNSFTMNAVPSWPGVKGSGSESSSLFSMV